MGVIGVIVIGGDAVGRSWRRCQRDRNRVHGKYGLHAIDNFVRLSGSGEVESRQVVLVLGRVAAKEVVETAVLLVNK